MTTPVVLITGALTGIGRATALAFAQEGARIVVSGRRDEAEAEMNAIEQTVERSYGKPLPQPKHDLRIVPQNGRTAALREMFRGALLWRTIWLWIVVSCLWSTFYLFSIYLPDDAK